MLIAWCTKKVAGCESACGTLKHNAPNWRRARKPVQSLLMSGLLMAASLLLFTLCSCRQSGNLPGSRGDENLQVFIANEVFRWKGAHKQPSMMLTNKAFDYSFIRDADGCQVFCHGDKSRELAMVLRNLYGPPALVGTNPGGYFSVHYSISQIGVALDCGVDGWDLGDKDKIITQLVLVQASALR